MAAVATHISNDNSSPVRFGTLNCIVRRITASGGTTTLTVETPFQKILWAISGAESAVDGCYLSSTTIDANSGLSSAVFTFTANWVGVVMIYGRGA